MINKTKIFLSNFILDIKFRTKLFLIYFTLIIIPLFLFTYISNNRMTVIIENNMIDSAAKSFEQASIFVSAKINGTKNTSDIVMLEENINQAFIHMTQKYDIPLQMKDYYSIIKFLSNLNRNKDIYRIRIFVPDELVYARQELNIFSMEDIKNELWFKELIENSGRISWYSAVNFAQTNQGANNIISAVRMIKNPNNYNQYLGVLSVDILESDIINILESSANRVKSSIVYIANSKGELIASSARNATQHYQIPLDRDPTESDQWQDIELGGERTLVRFKGLENSDWMLYAILPFDELMAASYQARIGMYILMVIIGVAAYFLAYFITETSMQRLYRLNDNMKKVQSGNLDIVIIKQGRDEIGELIVSFNFMIRRIKDLVEDQFLLGRDVKEVEIKLVQAELRALQAQINPHFLYNTLDLINWMAIKHDCVEIETTIHALSKFYKLSLSKGNDIISIIDEIQHVTAYVQIQNLRFENRIKLETDIALVSDYTIPKIIFQPLVENSILHGILPKKGEVGCIKISAIIEDEIIVLRITDDGIGMDSNKLDDMLIPQATDDLNGYGVRNIDERLKFYFGSEYSMKYKSERGVGTAVEIRIPARK